MAVSSRSALPTPTSRRGSSIGSPAVVRPWTTRATSRPSTSPRTMPPSTTISSPASMSRSTRSVGAGAGAGARAAPASAGTRVVPSTTQTDGPSANRRACRARTPAALAPAREVQVSQPVPFGPGQGGAERPGRLAVGQHPARRRCLAGTLGRLVHQRRRGADRAPPPLGGPPPTGDQARELGAVERGTPLDVDGRAAGTAGAHRRARTRRTPATRPTRRRRPARRPTGGCRCQHECYFDLRLPYRRSKRSMRPPVSTSFCLPV